MALPIKATPVLTGKAAIDFRQQVEKIESEPIPKKDYLRAKRIYEACIKAWEKTGE